MIFKKLHSLLGNKKARLVVLGGGTGLSVLLKGIKHYPWEITAVVSMADDGGSSGKLRDELGILPPGDIRNCMVALAEREAVMEELFNYRFKKGEGLIGHSLGNLIAAALVDVYGSFDKALEKMSSVLAIKGKVLPSTLENIALRANLSDGSCVVGESNISKSGKRIEKISLEPKSPKAYSEALEEIRKADILVLGPGSLYTSLIPNLLVDGVLEAILASKASKIYVCNVMTQHGETNGYTASDHLKAIYKHSQPDFLDYILLNSREIEDPDILEKYASEGARPVAIDSSNLEKMPIKIVKKPLIDLDELVRHNSLKIAEAIAEIAIEDKKMSFLERMCFREIMKNKE